MESPASSQSSTSTHLQGKESETSPSSKSSNSSISLLKTTPLKLSIGDEPIKTQTVNYVNLPSTSAIQSNLDFDRSLPSFSTRFGIPVDSDLARRRLVKAHGEANLIFIRWEQMARRKSMPPFRNSSSSDEVGWMIVDHDTDYVSVAEHLSGGITTSNPVPGAWPESAPGELDDAELKRCRRLREESGDYEVHSTSTDCAQLGVKLGEYIVGEKTAGFLGKMWRKVFEKLTIRW